MNDLEEVTDMERTVQGEIIFHLRPARPHY